MLTRLALISLIFGNFLILNNLSIFLEYKFYGVNSADLVIVLLLDWKSIIFLRTVIFISGIVILYRKRYMRRDLNRVRFLLLVILFVLSIVLIIISPNLIRILLGWDGLGLISYCLVIFYQNVKSYNAGILTILSNRVGDAAILLAIAWILNYGGWNFYFYLEYIDKDGLIVLIGVLVILAGITKRAQIPFRAWLPAAIAAPTPVSALVHSSTLVTAGVYLLIRFSPLLVNTILFRGLILIGVLTMFISGLGANFEYDLKKIIALSTLSQLGLIICILGAGFRNLAFFHLLAHAFFKSMLFLCAGILIHRFGDMQDIRFMGNSVKFIPLTCGIFNIANLALCGLPFMTGFYSKDLILEINLLTNLNVLSFFLCYFSTGLTVCYSVRVFYWRFISEFNFLTLVNFHDEDWLIIAGIVFLFILRVSGGACLAWLIMPVISAVYLPLYLKILVLGVISGGIFLGIFINYFYIILSFRNQLKFLRFLGGIWFLPYLTTYGVRGGILKLGLNFKKILDLGWIEELLVLNVTNNLRKLVGGLQVIHINNLKIYILIFVSWIFLVFIVFICLNNL